NRPDCLQRAGHAVINLLDRIRMLDGHDPARVPLNTDTWLLFAIGRQQRRFYRHIKLLATAFYVKKELIVGMFVNVLQQGDRIVYWRVIKSANDVPRTQARRRSRRV